MEKYRVIDHTGDIGVRIFGTDPPELFANAGEAFFSLITDPARIRAVETRRIHLEAGDLEGLLVAWLNELLYLFDTRDLLLASFCVALPAEGRLDATARGEPFDKKRHPLKTAIKAVTYHQLYVQRRETGWEAQVIFDV